MEWPQVFACTSKNPLAGGRLPVRQDCDIVSFQEALHEAVNQDGNASAPSIPFSVSLWKKKGKRAQGRQQALDSRFNRLVDLELAIIWT